MQKLVTLLPAQSQPHPVAAAVEADAAELAAGIAAAAAVSGAVVLGVAVGSVQFVGGHHGVGSVKVG